MAEETKTPAAVEGDGEKVIITYDNERELPYIVMTNLLEMTEHSLPEVRIDAAKELRWWVEAMQGLSAQESKRVSIIKENINHSQIGGWICAIIATAIAASAFTISIVRLLI